MRLATGSRLGHYEIAGPIGSGSMGDVYRARDLKLGRDVALKTLKAEFASDPDRLRRFEQEARAASGLNHPNIVHIYDIDREGQTHYIVMELVEGHTLRQLLDGAPLDNSKLLAISRQIASALAKAHAAGIVHRDLKPENIMVSSDGFVKLLDFGLAKLADMIFDSHSEMVTMARGATLKGTLLGTVEYMSPEQAAGRAVDFRSDQFSFGLILYEMATGKLAFKRETAAQTLASIIESEPAPLRELNRDCPENVLGVVSRCLAKEPANRYADSRSLVRELERLPEETASPGAARTRNNAEPERRLPSIPPMPQNDPNLGFGGQLDKYLSHELRQALANDSGFFVKAGGRTRKMSERRLRRRLRRLTYSGLEMVRRENEDDWVQLAETRMFREEVPFEGDPIEWSARRKALELARHFGIFAAMMLGWFVFTGRVESWFGFWGIGLFAHAVGTVPAGLTLWRTRKGVQQLADPNDEVIESKAEVIRSADPTGQLEARARLLSPEFVDDVERVKSLLERRAGEQRPELVSEVERIVERVTDIAGKQADLEEQTSLNERDRLELGEKDTEARLAASTSAADQKLLRRHLEVMVARREAIDKALAVLDRLKIRREVAEHQIKQLRLDLSRSEASSASGPELTSRLQDIRHEVDATEDVDEAIAQELLS